MAFTQTRSPKVQTGPSFIFIEAVLNPLAEIFGVPRTLLGDVCQSVLGSVAGEHLSLRFEFLLMAILPYSGTVVTPTPECHVAGLLGSVCDGGP